KLLRVLVRLLRPPPPAVWEEDDDALARPVPMRRLPPEVLGRLDEVVLRLPVAVLDRHGEGRELVELVFPAVGGQHLIDKHPQLLLLRGRLLLGLLLVLPLGGGLFPLRRRFGPSPRSRLFFWRLLLPDVHQFDCLRIL